jgi:tRNA threonylcarbamoyladenosine biosynthesis protein TsaB
VATATGLALAQQKPLVGVTSLRVLARGLVAGTALCAPLIDAHKGEVYAALYELDASSEGGVLIERLAPFHAPPQEAGARVRAAAGERPFGIGGNALSRYGESLREALGPLARRAPTFCDVPRAACLAFEAELQLQRHGPSDLASLEPMYLRPSDAKLPTQRGE